MQEGRGERKKEILHLYYGKFSMKIARQNLQLNQSNTIFLNYLSRIRSRFNSIARELNFPLKFPQNLSIYAKQFSLKISSF